MKRLTVLSVMAGLIAAASPLFAAGLVVVDDSSWWHGPIPPQPFPPRRPMPPPWQPPSLPSPRPHLFAPIEVSFVKVQTRITDQVAVTSVDQEFFNPNSSRIEGS